MQKIATKIFIGSSIVFGIIGILLILMGGLDGNNSPFVKILRELLFTAVFIILPSFALSIASKYLK
ncbi:MAG: hypothetical protein WC933_00985 [Candidatus Paceibacterota bacterium]|jgi:hypothetical protein